MTRRKGRNHRPAVESLEGRALMTAGALDTTFGGTGNVITAVGSYNSWAMAVAVQPDLKIVAVGHAAVKSHGRIVNEIGLVRYNPNGTLDGSFGSGGIAMLPANEWYLSFGAAALQADGKIVVAIDASGTSFTNTNWEILRFNANGSLDKTFGGSGTGKVTTSFPGGYDIPEAIAIQPTDGKIVVVGSANGALAAARYTTGGTLDTSFGTGGEVITPISPSGSVGESAVAIDSLGRIIVGGAVNGSNLAPAVVRYNPNGTLDTSFGAGGVQTVSLPPSFPSADTTGLGLQSTGSDAGKIVVSMSGNGGLALTRLNPDGSPDGGFGSSGFYVESRMGSGVGLAIQPDDKLIMAGRPAAGGYNYVVTRVLADGSSYDPSFGSAGLGQTQFGTQAGDNAMALAPDGKIVVAGSYGSSPEEFAAVRFLGGPLSTTTTRNPSTYGQSVTFTATVTAGYSYDTPSGTVSLDDGSTLLDTGTLSTANAVTTATFTTASLAAGTHSITATYGGANDLGSTSAALTQTVNATASTALATGAMDASATGTPDSMLGPLVLDETLFLDSLADGKRRRSQ